MLPDAAIADRAYQDALRWLYGLSPNVRTAAEIVADHPRKLARMRALLAAVGDPQQAFSGVLVAGTKGKGSIAAGTDAILRAAGLRSGLITSPHLVSWCERTRVDGEDVAPATVGRLMPTVRAAVERLSVDLPELGYVTTFEAGLACGLLAFADARVEVAVVEAGVGARHDATNVLDPLAVAVGPISYDHTATLGRTLASIAAEKAGVLRPGRLAVVAEQPAEAAATIEREAATVRATLERIPADWGWQPDDGDRCAGPFTVAGPRGRFVGLTSPLLGRHQRENATAAVALATGVLELHGRAPSSVAAAPAGRCGHDRAVRTGLASVRWPGRFQVIRERPWLIVDGAHNGDSAGRLVEALDDCFPDTRRHLVFGTSVGKDLPRMLDALLPAAASVRVTRSRHERSVGLDELASAIRGRGMAARATPDVPSAVDAALAEAAPDDLVVVTGSLFVVGEALAAFARQGSAGGAP